MIQSTQIDNTTWRDEMSAHLWLEVKLEITKYPLLHRFDHSKYLSHGALNGISKVLPMIGLGGGPGG
jgi:hypothetical protein